MAAGKRHTERKHETLTHVLAIVGAGGALVGWVAVVGGIREYARFDAAGIPSPSQTASLLPRETLIADGLSALLPSLAIACGLGFLTYVVARLLVGLLGHQRRYPPRYKPAAWEERALRALVPSLIIVGWLALAPIYGWGWIEPIVAVVFAIIAAGALELGWFAGAVPMATTVLVATVIGGGAAAFIEPLWNSNGKFDTVLVTRRGLPPLAGFYLTRSGGHVYVLVLPAAKGRAGHSKRFSMLAVPESEVELIEIGPSYKLRDGRPVEHKVNVTKLPEPKGPTIYEASEHPKKGTALKISSLTANYGNTTTTTYKTTTTNNNTNSSNNHNTTISTTTVINQAATAPLPELMSVIQLFALDEVVPVGDHFCFALGASNVPESLRVHFDAPTMPAGSRTFTPEQTVTAKRHGRELLTVHLSSAVRERLRDGRRLPVNVRVTSTSTGHAGSQTAYHLELQQPGGLPSPGGASWEKAPDFASCARARPAPAG
jgi:hypothetical protein